MTRLLSALFLATALVGPLEARIDQPSHVFYGNATLFGQGVEPGTIIEARLAVNGEALVSYKMGRDPRLNGQYALPISMDDVDPRQPGHARPGNELEIYIGTRLAGTTIVGPIGRATRLDIDPQFVAGGPIISIGDVQVLEGSSGGLTPVDLQVSLSTTADEEILVDWRTRDDSAIGAVDCGIGGDFVAASGRLAIPAGSLQGTVSIDACADTAAEPDERFIVELVSTSQGSFQQQSAQVVLIDDDDNPDIAIGDAWITEPVAGSAQAVFAVSLSRDHDRAVSFDWSTEDMTATAGQDYVAAQGTLQIPAGDISARIEVTVLADSEVEPQEAFALRLSNPNFGNLQRSTSTAVIVDPDHDPTMRHEQDAVNEQDGIYGIADPTAVAVSGDGQHVYATSESTGQLTIFSRSGFAGTLSVLATIDSSVEGFSSMLLDGPVDVVLSQDDAHVYVAAKAADAIVAFERDPGDGSLTFIGNQVHGSASVTGLQAPSRVVLSPDGRHLYASASNSVAVFSREPATGALTFLEAEQNNIDDPDDSGGTVIALDRGLGLAVAPSGDQLLVASRLGDALLVFNRDEDPSSSTFGELSFVEALQDNIAGIEGLDGATDVQISESGDQVYVTAEASNTLTHFTRDTDGGLLQHRIWTSGESTLPGMAGSQHLLLAPDNVELFVTGFVDSSLTAFRRTLASEDPPAAGDLRVTETFFDDQDPTHYLNGATDMAVSPNNLHLYVVANRDNAIVVFTRLSADSLFGDNFMAP